MDIEKLIERMRTESLYADKASLKIMDLCMEAATALSTLQTENKKLRAELKQVKEERDAAVKDMELIVRRINDCNIKLDDGTTVSNLELGRCHVCKHEETGDCGNGGCIFEWRGPQKED